MLFDMQEIMYTKSTDGIAYQIAHVYEHAFIMHCIEMLSNTGPAPLLTDFSAETFYATFMYIQFDSFSPEASLLIHSLFTSNPRPSQHLHKLAITQTECEDCATATIIDEARYQEQLDELCLRPWTPLTTQPVISEGRETQSCLVYSEDRSRFKRATITIDFGALHNSDIAILNRLVLLVTSSISQQVMLEIGGYTHDSSLLEVNGGQATLSHVITVPASTEKTSIMQAVTNALILFTDEHNRSDIQNHLDSWSKDWTQQASINYYRETGILAGSVTTARLFKSYDYVSTFKKATVRISLRKIRT